MNAMNTNTLKVVTHNGAFHADDVFACAFLSLLHGGNIEIVRSRDPFVWETADYVLDVGGAYDTEKKRFDHHQEGGAGSRLNGTPYSSVGLLWKEYGEQYVGSEYVARVIDERLIQAIDAGDNGVETFTTTGVVTPYIIQDAIVAFRPKWNEDRTQDECFLEAVEFAKGVLVREIEFAKSEQEGKRFAEEAYQNAEDKRIVVLEGHYPWYEALQSHPEPLFLVKPDRAGEGKWKIEAVRDNAHTLKNRKDLPRSWAGKMGEDLARISGVPGALFCHNKLFVAVAASKEAALHMARIAVDTL